MVFSASLLKGEKSTSGANYGKVVDLISVLAVHLKNWLDDPYGFLQTLCDSVILPEYANSEQPATKKWWQKCATEIAGGSEE